MAVSLTGCNVIATAVFNMLISLFCFGNPSRGDDAVGPLMHDWLQQLIEPESDFAAAMEFRLVLDFQLEPEHIFDLDDCDLGIFIDCHCNIENAFVWQPVQTGNQISISSHSVTAESLLFLYQTTFRKTAPPCFLLGIAGNDFELGLPASESSLRNLEQAKAFLLQKLQSGGFTEA